jgi:bifunctional ADP-heptose synthase (sugar kinase/adenylyltransferase)
MLHAPGEAARELNRLDIKNRVPVAEADQAWLRSRLEGGWPGLDGLIVLDQVSEADCGVVTASVRAFLAELGRRDPAKPVLADSRERIGLFEGVMVKPNERECLRAVGGTDLARASGDLAGRCGRTVFCTAGPEGITVASPGSEPIRVRAVPVSGPVDTVGAGDSTSAAIVGALAAGGIAPTAAAFGTLVASITIQELGATGTASPEQVRARHGEVTT